MSNDGRARDLVKAFETAVEQYFLGAEDSDAPRQRIALRDMARAAVGLEALSGGRPAALEPLLGHANEEVRSMATAYQGGAFPVLEDNLGVRVPDAEPFGEADDARVQGLVQTYRQSVLDMWAARKAGDAKAVSRASLALTRVPFGLMTMEPSRLPALAVLLDDADPTVRITAAATLSAAMPDRVTATLRDLSATRPGTPIAQQAAALLQKLSTRG